MHPAGAQGPGDPGTSERAASEPHGLTSAFLRPIADVRGVGPARLERLTSRGIVTVLDLLLHAPTRYRTAPRLWNGEPFEAGVEWTIRGLVASARRVRQRRGGTFLDLRLKTDHGLVRACFYNRGWLKHRVGAGDSAMVAGRLTSGEAPMLAGTDLWVGIPDADVPSVLAELRPVHPSVPGVPEGTIQNLVSEALGLIAGERDPVDGLGALDLDLPGLEAALRAVHQPATREDAERGGARLLFDRLLATTLSARTAFAARPAASPIRAEPRIRARIQGRFPFRLTPEQQTALDEILADMEKPIAMRRLLLGDVGSGKTAVATGALLAAIAAGFQGLLVAPTELLASQHHATLTAWLAGSRVRLGFLSARDGRPAMRAVKERIRRGDVDLVIGTHAALAADVEFPRLGLGVVDEQHRFGVMQRLAARRKGAEPHLLAMSATPIPRSLCLALFGELAITRIGARPAGRQTPPTFVSERGDAYADLRSAIARGERAFVVFPSIASKDIPAVERAGRALLRPGAPLSGLRVAFLHGGMDAAAQLSEFGRFQRGDAHVLVATVIVEVGVDVPEATIMIVEGADSFGLASLHQLRGRVGRGAMPARVHLLPSKRTDATSPTAARLSMLAREKDGFRIAEADLLMRGPGDWCGLRQHGFGGELPLAAGRDAGILDAVARAAGAMIARGYDPAGHPYLSALASAIGGLRFEPRDAV